MNWKRKLAMILGMLVLAVSARLNAAGVETAATDLAGQWVAYHWDGEGAPVRLELEIQVQSERQRFTGVLRASGAAPRYFQGPIAPAGAVDPAGGFRIELLGRGESRVELGRQSKGAATVAFWKE